jgi:hypothetical protein
MTKKPKRRTRTTTARRRPDGLAVPFDDLASALLVYLKSIGWTALVIGSPRIQHQPDEAPLNYEFVVRFTGGQKK